MITVLILICAISTPRPDCQIGTALDFYYAPDAQNEIMCAMHGQAQVAKDMPEATVARIKNGQEYIKVRCQRPTSIGKEVG